MGGGYITLIPPKYVTSVVLLHYVNAKYVTIILSEFLNTKLDTDVVTRIFTVYRSFTFLTQVMKVLHFFA